MMETGNGSAHGEVGAVKAFSASSNDKQKSSMDRRNRWRQRMPDPAEYYRQVLDGLRESTDGWFTARCPFHEDRVRSLTVNLGHGGWRCHAGCGSGDMISFETRLRDCDFKSAVLRLTGVRL